MPTIHVRSHAEFTKYTTGPKLCVVDFFATWCGPCKAIAPRFEKLSDQYTNVVFLKVDVDEHQSIARECSVSAMPTFHLYKSGKKLDEVVGADIVRVERLVSQHASGSSGFPASGGRVLGTGAPVKGAAGGGAAAGEALGPNYALWGVMGAVIFWLWWNKNDPSQNLK
ncbi:thioredoxin-domain-containing protein [Fimicolochytrium jonesii]|uniref:thioredoxin-domain-containing protein n=1 Tax=Fimicolochytrium jonesii TaxID=1396493 RepID=UPI0022FE3F30|nr:thioredoxin-domain-containing protein [Fimicolochytrium jonesii]KAI8817332.1 thioredoxin-domain-containing protein [Fimicolochytrium jonesii]